MPITLEVDGQSLRVEPAADGDATLVWVDRDAAPLVLGTDDRVDLCASLVSSLERALSDEFTVVGSIAGVPILHLLALERSMIYLSMDRSRLFVQDDENNPIGELAVDEARLARWAQQLRHG